jgi:hypothetical protein
VIQTPDLTPDLTAGLTPDPEQAPSVPSPAAVNLPADIVDPILDDAAARSGVPRDQLVVTRAEPVVWPDGGLGCPEPGVMYIQVLVDGYWVVVHTGKQELDYRGGERGGFRLCTSEQRDRQLPVNPGGGGAS